MEFKADAPAPCPPTPTAEEKQRGAPRPRFSKKLDRLIVRLARDGFNDKAIAADNEVQSLRPGVNARQISKRRTRLGWHRKQPPEGHARIPARRIIGMGAFETRDRTPKPKPVKLPTAAKRIGYELVLRFPDGRETKAPITERQAEVWALRIIKGDL